MGETRRGKIGDARDNSRRWRISVFFSAFGVLRGFERGERVDSRDDIVIQIVQCGTCCIKQRGKAQSIMDGTDTRIVWSGLWRVECIVLLEGENPIKWGIERWTLLL